MTRYIPLLMVLGTFLLRVAGLEAKGLSYDEAASAMMARAPVGEIVFFHWDAAFEHLPGWVLLMRAWLAVMGQSEAALRLLPAFAGVLTVALVWRLLGQYRRDDHFVRLLTTSLLALSPILQLYAQEARMYSLVVTLCVGATIIWFAMIGSPSWRLFVAFVLIAWGMLGLQYYSALLLPSLALCTLYAVVRTRQWSKPVLIYQSLAITTALVPLVLWMAFSPGFRETLEVVLSAAAGTPITKMDFLRETLIDLTFGAVRWSPPYAATGMILFFPVAIGLASSTLHAAKHQRPELRTVVYSDLYPMVALLLLVPLLATALLFTTASTRYILFITPYMLILVGTGIDFLWKRVRSLALVTLIAVVCICVWGMVYYFADYEKSEYRQMARYLTERLDPEQDIVLLEAPRQHLLARYYLPQQTLLTSIPDVDLPAFWPITAPLVIPDVTDGVIQSALHSHATVWVIYAGEAEVDPGEFVAKYLMAVAFKQDCGQWLDVRLCRYISPRYVDGSPVEIDPGVVFGGELRLAGAQVAPFYQPVDANMASLLVRLDWEADLQPTRNYKVTLRMLRDSEIVAQSDALPIGPLLPPVTWQKGDRKPGYMVLALPGDVQAGDYSLQIGIYDAETLERVHFRRGSAEGSEPLDLIRLTIDDTIAVSAETTPPPP